MSNAAGVAMPMASAATDIGTAVGTIALAVVTFLAVIVTIVITVQDRRKADQRLHDERQDARDREQLAEARVVEVILGTRPAGPEDAKDTNLTRVPDATGDLEEDLRQLGYVVLTAAVINHGRYPITGIEFHLYLRQQGEVPFSSAKRISGDKARDDTLLGGVTPFEGDWTEKTVLTPWDTGLALTSNPMVKADTVDAHVDVRWTDQWGTLWENHYGRVRKVEPNAGGKQTPAGEETRQELLGTH
jgi:hypothetical protein